MTTETALIIVVAILALVVAFLAYRLAQANKLMASWAGKCLEHSMAWSNAQRVHMDATLRRDQAEMLLREQREAAAAARVVPSDNGGRRRQKEEDFSDISVPVGSNGLVT